ncbi:MAG TPA: DUF6134 family protein [Gemmatimonadaceae bacterium]|nr:DUF6134 family protein [Gemmatimonadaceae bacterium]
MSRRFRPTRSCFAMLASSLLLTPPLLGAQGSPVVDEGSFTITQQGNPYGREAFRIVRTPAPGGQVYRATGQGALGDHRVTSVLGVDSTGVPLSYESDVTIRGEVVQHLQGRGRPGRFSILNQTKAGEAAREYVLNAGALLLDGDFIHHYFFVPFVGDHGTLSVIAPRNAQQLRFTLEDAGADNLELAGKVVESRHFVLKASDGARRDVWVDGRGRLLKVVIPERGLIAVRDELPR